MLNKFKQIFNRKFLAFSMFFVLSIVLSAIVSFSNKTTTQANAVAEQHTLQVENKNIIEHDFLTLNVVDNDQPIISKTGWGGSGDSIDGGTLITVSGSESSVIVSWDGNTQTYTPDNGYQIDSLKIYAASSATGTPAKTITIEEIESGTSFTPEDIIKDYAPSNNQIFIKAITSEIQYTLYGYYQADDNSNEYIRTTGSTYTIANNDNVQNLNTTNMLGTDTINNFGYWILRKEAIKENSYNGYTVDVDSENKIIIISKDANGDGDCLDLTDVKVELSYNGEIENGYKLTSLNKDTINEIKTYSFGNIEQISTNPLIAAKISRTYDLKITSGSGGWNNSLLVDDDNTTEEKPSKSSLVGAVSSETFEDETDYIAKLKIKDNSSYAYQFTSNASYAFYKGSEIASVTNSNVKSSVGTTSYYYVYNYGYEISGWKVYFYYDDANEDTNDYYALTTGFQLATTGKASLDENDKVATGKLSGKNLSELAALIDERFAGTNIATSAIKLTIEPVWQAVKIDVTATKYNSSDPVTTQSVTTQIEYNDKEGYDFTTNGFNENVGKPDGKEIINYKTTNGNIIVDNGTWNYINIPHGDYIYSTGTYTLNVTAEYVDNIYKVSLSEIEDSDTLDTSNGYATATTYSDSIYTYSSYNQDDYEFEYYSSGLIENYITGDFTTCKNDYISGISGGFEILNKVYGSNDYIYLTNAHTYTMPVFTRANYDLIFYANSDNKEYNYKTSVYDAASGNTELLKAYDAQLSDESGITFGSKYTYSDSSEATYSNGSEYFSSNKHKNWNYSDGGSYGNFAIKAEWFRKYYNLDINTFLTGETSESFHGYVKVEIEDEIDGTKSGNYVVMYHNNEMQIYSCSDSIKDLELVPVANANVLNIVDDDKYLKLYAGCNITITAVDQSGDPSAALKDNRFVDMVGYKYDEEDKTTYNPTNCSDAFNVRLYTPSISKLTNKDDIEELKYDCAKVIEIDVYFEQIQYDFDIKINNLNAGNFEVNRGNRTTYYKVEKPKIGTRYAIEYVASSGFEFDENAFTLTKGNNKSPSKTLYSYSTTEETGKLSPGKQIYSLQFSSAWLRDNYYKVFDNDCSTSDVSDIQVNLNTKAIEFKFGVKLDTGNGISEYYLFKNSTEEYGLVEEDIGNVYFSLNDWSNATSVAKTTDFEIVDFLTELEDGVTYILDIGGKQYALIESRLYSNPLKVDNVNRVQYDFLLTDEPGALTINQSMIGIALNLYNGVIPASENRNLYIYLQARELFEITINVEDVANDPNGDRSTIVSNSAKNTVVVDKNVDGTILYTYEGAENSIVSTIDIKRYSSECEYYLDGAKIGDTFTTTGNHTLKIKYIPKPLTAYRTYFVDGVEIDASDVSTYFKTNSLTAFDTTDKGVAHNELYCGYKLKYEYELVDSDYELTIKVNNKELNSILSVNGGYTVLASDYDFEGVHIDIYLTPRDTKNIRVRYVLTEDKYISDEPYYGEINVYEQGIRQQDEETTSNEVVVGIIAGREVYFDLTIFEGYEYAGYYTHNEVKKETRLTKQGNDDKVNDLYICDSYDFLSHPGTYKIYLQKKNVHATLTSNDNYYINDNKKDVDGLYVNQVITFKVVEAEDEVLDYFYYTDKNSNSVVITEDQLLNGLTLTSDLLATLNYTDGSYIIDFGVETKDKYKVEYIINNKEYKKDFAAYVNGDKANVCVSGNYYLEDSTISFDLTTLKEGKYKIIVLKDKIQVGDSYDKLNALEFTLTADTSFIIKMEPKTFNPNITENVYNNLYDFTNKTPILETSPVGKVNKTGYYYLNRANIYVDYKATDRVLYEMEISSVVEKTLYVNGSVLYLDSAHTKEVDFEYIVDTENSIVIINGTNYNIEDGEILASVVSSLSIKIEKDSIKYYNGSDWVTSNPNSDYVVTLNKATNRVKLEYVTQSVVNITYNYLAYKTITQN